MKCEQCQKNIEEREEKPESKRIIIDGWEYDLETTQKGVLFADLKIPDGAVLWTVEDFGNFTLDQWINLGLLDDWFFIEQFSRYWEKKGKVARFITYADRVSLSCGWDPRGSDPGLGVRWKYEVKEK